MEMAFFDYPTLFFLPRLQAIDCCLHQFQSFNSRNGWQKNLKMFTGTTMQSLLVIRAMCICKNVITELLIDDMVNFLAHCPELARREYTFLVLRLCCLYLGQVCPVLPSVRLGSPMPDIETADLSFLIEPLQS